MFIPIPETSNERAMLTAAIVCSDVRFGGMYLCISITSPARRHDNDRKNPRTPKNIYDLNRQMTKRMQEIFLSRGIPVVPTIGERSGLRFCHSIGLG